MGQFFFWNRLTAAEEWCARLACAGEHSGVELGVHGDCCTGLEHEGLAGVVAAAFGAAAAAVDDGVPEVSGRGGLAAVPNRACRAACDLPVVAVEPLGQRAVSCK